MCFFLNAPDNAGHVRRFLIIFLDAGHPRRTNVRRFFIIFFYAGHVRRDGRVVVFMRYRYALCYTVNSKHY